MYLNVFNFSRRVAGKRAFANDLKLLHAVSGAVLLHPAEKLASAYNSAFDSLDDIGHSND